MGRKPGTGGHRYSDRPCKNGCGRGCRRPDGVCSRCTIYPHAPRSKGKDTGKRSAWLKKGYPCRVCLLGAAEVPGGVCKQHSEDQ